MTNDITERLSSAETGMETWLWVPLIKLLALGDPVDIAELAATTRRSEAEVRQALAAVPDTEYEDGRIVGLGLTLRPTRHRFEVNGEQLYTWCALDTLILPRILGTSARIDSTGPGATVPVRVSVGAGGVTGVEPAEAVVSLINPQDLSSVRSAFCNQVHFFPSAEAARPWLDAHPEGSVVPVAEAYRLASTMAENMLNQALAIQTAGRGKGAQGCGC
jgi:alkylmercury lyase